MRILVLIFLLLAAHFDLTAFAPSPAGKALVYWPWAADSRSILVGVIPEGGGIVVPGLAGIAGLCFLAAAGALLGIIVPIDWWTPLIGVGAAASIVLFVLFLSPLSLIPVALNLILLWGVFLQHWTAAGLQGS